MPKKNDHSQSSDPPIATCLLEQRDVILNRWVSSVKVKLPAGDENSKLAIRDHIPQILDRLGECLTEACMNEEVRQKLKALAKEHGRQRSELPAYTIQQVVAEYRILRKTLVDILSKELKTEEPEKTWQLIHEFIDECIEHAVSEFSIQSGTELKQVHLQLESQVEELEQALRLREEFISVASHELKTPLTALLLQLQLLERTAIRQNAASIPAEFVAKSIGKAAHQTGRMRDMLERLLDLSRLRSNRFHLDIATTDLCALVADAVARLKPQAEAAGSKIEMTSENCQELFAYIDPLRIEQLINNLVSNAIKYGNGKPIHVALNVEGDEAYIAVRDEGIGITPEDQERIFNRFERATSAKIGESLGLGLYIAREIARAHGGDITVKSELRRGSVFTVRLPLKRVDLATPGEEK